jgi:hypothetical protein
VGRNKKLREKIAALERNIEAHKRKTAIEAAKLIPNEDFMSHWRAEIAEWDKQRVRLLRRLRRDW